MTVCLSFRPATPADRDPMMAIGHEGLRPYVEPIRGWDENAEREGFYRHFVPEHINIIRVNGTDAGYYKTVDYQDHVELEGIYLAAAFRSKGVGSQVLQRLIERGEPLEKPLRLRVFQNNPAQRLYQRLGFRLVDESATHLTLEY